jgi:hypothetical protein
MSDNLAALRRKSASLVGTVDPAELACRMLEAAQNMKRPAGATAQEAIDGLGAESRAWIMAQALAALEYMAECFSKGTKPQ